MKRGGKLFLYLVILAIAALAFLYLAGPHAEFARAFTRYRDAHLAGDGARVAELTAPAEIAFVDRQRQLALAASHAEVEALPFRLRAGVLGLRQQVLEGRIPLALVQQATPEDLYAQTQEIRAKAAVLAPMEVIFAVPTGTNSGRGYVKITAEPVSFYHYPLAASLGLYYGFVRTEGGEWRVDPSPIVDSSATENEYWATQMEPTGNRFIIEAMLGVTDPARVALLWEPLVNP